MAENFNWDDHEEVPEGNDFWDQFDSEDSQTQPMGKDEAYLRGAAQGYLLDYADEAAGAGEAALDTVKGKSSLENFPKQYEKRRDESRALFKQAEKEHPVPYLSGNVSGNVAQQFTPGLNVLGGAKKAGLALTLGKGAAQGLLTGFGANEKPEDLKKDLIFGTASGAGGGLLGKGFEAGLSRITGAGAKKLAQGKALAASGGTARDFIKAEGKGKFDDLTNMLLDDKFVTPLSTTEEIAGRLSKAKDLAEKDIDDYIAQVSKMGTAKDVSPAQIRDKLIVDLMAENPHTPISELQPAIEKIDTWLLGQPEKMGLQELQDLKRNFNKFLKDIDFDRNPNQNPMSKQGLLQVRKAVKEAIEDVSDKATGKVGKVKGKNKKLGLLIEAENMAAKKAAADKARGLLGLTDTIWGAGLGAPTALAQIGAGQGLSDAGLNSLIMAGVGIGGNKLARKYGNSVMATGFNSFAKNLARLPQYANMAARQPQAFMKLAEKLFSQEQDEEVFDLAEPVPLGMLQGQ